MISSRATGQSPSNTISELRIQEPRGLRSEERTTMFHHLCCADRRLRMLAFACVVALAISRPLWSASCVGPAPLEARVHAHPDANAYAALGEWFGNHHQSECAAQAFQEGLKLEPASSWLSYLLGLSLYSAGKPQEAVIPLRHSVGLDAKDEKAHLLLASADRKSV